MRKFGATTHPARYYLASDLERRQGWAALPDETRNIVPVDHVRSCVRDDDRASQLPELLGPPVVHARVLALRLDLDPDWFFHPDTSLQGLSAGRCEHFSPVTEPHHGHLRTSSRGYLNFQCHG